MSGSTSRLTVGLPVYNGEQYLDATLTAIRSQTFSDFELVVADNASTDATRDIVEAHRADDPRVHLDVAARNEGAAANWNRCYTGATTPLFTWACADDVPLPGKYQACIDLLDNADPSTALAYTGTQLIDENGTITGPFVDIGALDEPSPAARFQRIVRDLELVHPLFGVLRTDILKSTSGMAAYKRADTVLLGELALRGQFAFEPEVHFQRRMHPEVSMQGSDAAIAAHYTGTADGAPTYPNARLLAGHLGAIRSAPLTAGERLRCLAAMRRWQYRKRVLRDARRALTAPVRRVRGALSRS